MAHITQRRDIKRESVIITIEVTDEERSKWDLNKERMWEKFTDMIKYFGNIPQLPSRLP